MRYLVLLAPLFLYGYNLKELISLAKQNNHLVKSKSYELSSKEAKLKSADSDYFPTIDLQAFYRNKDNPDPFTPKGIYGGGAKLEYNIYDGSRRYYNKKAKESDKKASRYEKLSSVKEVELAVTKEFFTVKSLQAKLKALKKAKEAIATQLKKAKEFYKVKLATKDRVDRLQSAYSNAMYEIEVLKYEILSHKKELELLVDTPVKTVDESEFVKQDAKKETLDAITSLKYKAQSINSLSETIDSYYYPQIKISDEYNFYGYHDKPNATLPFIGPLPVNYPDRQNKLLLTVGLRVFDFGKLSKEKEAVLKQKLSLNETILYKQKEQEKNIYLAKERIKTAKLSLKATKDSLTAAKSSFDVIKEKYEANLVDNVVYLDALTNLTKAKATYEDAKNQLELSYGMLYFYLGKDLEEYIK